MHNSSATIFLLHKMMWKELLPDPSDQASPSLQREREEVNEIGVLRNLFPFFTPYG
jgi:hypothetical protein